MPGRRTQDVVHAVMTDHLIERRPPSLGQHAPVAGEQDIEANQYRGEVVPYYPQRQSRTGEDALYTAIAQVSQKSNLTKGLPRLVAEIAAQKPANAAFYIEFGQAFLSTGECNPAPLEPLKRPLKRKPDSAVVSLNLADALTQAGQPDRAVTVLNRALKVTPDDALLWYQLGIAHSAAEPDAEAIAAFDKSVALDPDLTEAHNLLGAALAAEGDMDRSEKELLRALQINPDYPDAQGNLGHLLAARANLAECRVLLREVGPTEAQ